MCRREHGRHRNSLYEDRLESVKPQLAVTTAPPACRNFFGNASAQLAALCAHRRRRDSLGNLLIYWLLMQRRTQPSRVARNRPANGKRSASTPTRATASRVRAQPRARPFDAGTSTPAKPSVMVYCTQCSPFWRQPIALLPMRHAATPAKGLIMRNQLLLRSHPGDFLAFLPSDLCQAGADADPQRDQRGCARPGARCATACVWTTATCKFPSR